jgi:hypothetical protein
MEKIPTVLFQSNKEGIIDWPRTLPLIIFMHQAGSMIFYSVPYTFSE